VTSRPTRDGAILAVSGELDMAVSAGLRGCFDAALAQGAARVVLDLSGLEFCDSSGLAVILRAHRYAIADGGWIRLVGVQPRVARIILISGLGAVLPCYPSTDAAVDDLHAPGRATGQKLSESPPAARVDVTPRLGDAG